MSKALRAGARDGDALQGAGARRGGGGGKAASKMEDEEVAESWEEAADSGEIQISSQSAHCDSGR